MPTDFEGLLQGLSGTLEGAVQGKEAQLKHQMYMTELQKAYKKETQDRVQFEQTLAQRQKEALARLLMNERTLNEQHNYHTGMLENAQKQTQIRQQETNKPVGAGRQPTEYEIWKGQQPKGADVSLENYKRSMAQSVLNPKQIQPKDISPKSIGMFQTWEKTYKSNPYGAFADWMGRTKTIPESFKQQALDEAKAYWGIK